MSHHWTTAPHKLARPYWTIAVAFVGLLLTFAGSTSAANLGSSPKKRIVSFRLVGHAAPLPVTSFGANYETYVAALQSRDHQVSFVKLVYRFLPYDASLPASLMDYELVHRFRAVRQPDCDATAESLLYSAQVGPTGELLGRNFSFVYSRHAAEIAIPAATLLPCYVVTPADYKGSKHVSTHVTSLAREKAPAGTQAAKTSEP